MTLDDLVDVKRHGKLQRVTFREALAQQVCTRLVSPTLAVQENRVAAFVKKHRLPLLDRLKIFAELQLADGSSTIAQEFPWGTLRELEGTA